MKRENLLPIDGEAYLYEDFLREDEALYCEELLTRTVQWKQEPIFIMGKEIMQPRLTAWYGDPGKSYSYSGITMDPISWPDVLYHLKEKVEAVSDTYFNSALLNYYRDGKDSMGWHRDNEKSLGYKPIIASVSLGTSRKFKFRHSKEKERTIDITLSSGSLLIMKGDCQEMWYHSVPKQLRVQESRINITFRQIVDL